MEPKRTVSVGLCNELTISRDFKMSLDYWDWSILSKEPIDVILYLPLKFIGYIDFSGGIDEYKEKISDILKEYNNQNGTTFDIIFK